MTEQLPAIVGTIIGCFLGIITADLLMEWYRKFKKKKHSGRKGRIV